jgi:hypothetical protein
MGLLDLAQHPIAYAGYFEKTMWSARRLSR